MCRFLPAGTSAPSVTCIVWHHWEFQTRCIKGWIVPTTLKVCQTCLFTSRGLIPVTLLSLFSGVNQEWLKHCIYTGVQFRTSLLEGALVYLPSQEATETRGLSRLNSNLEKIIKQHTLHILKKYNFIKLPFFLFSFFFLVVLFLF